MRMNPIESAAVKAVGYEPDQRLMRIQFRSGSTYDYADITLIQFVNLMNASSVGKWIRDNLSGRNPQSVRQETTQNGSPEQRAGAPAETGPLNVIDPDADPCCVRALHSALSIPTVPGSGSLTCGTCGQEFLPELRDGLRFWRCVPIVAVVRK